MAWIELQRRGPGRGVRAAAAAMRWWAGGGLRVRLGLRLKLLVFLERQWHDEQGCGWAHVNCGPWRFAIARIRVVNWLECLHIRTGTRVGLLTPM